MSDWFIINFGKQELRKQKNAKFKLIFSVKNLTESNTKYALKLCCLLQWGTMFPIPGYNMFPPARSTIILLQGEQCSPFLNTICSPLSEVQCYSCRVNSVPHFWIQYVPPCQKYNITPAGRTVFPIPEYNMLPPVRSTMLLLQGEQCSPFLDTICSPLSEVQCYSCKENSYPHSWIHYVPPCQK